MTVDTVPAAVREARPTRLALIALTVLLLVLFLLLPLAVVFTEALSQGLPVRR
jgi:sulfate transport system permease protein